MFSHTHAGVLITDPEVRVSHKVIACRRDFFITWAHLKSLSQKSFHTIPQSRTYDPLSCIPKVISIDVRETVQDACLPPLPVSTYPPFSSAYYSWCLPYWSVVLGPKWDWSVDGFICQSQRALTETVRRVIKPARSELENLQYCTRQWRCLSQLLSLKTSNILADQLFSLVWEQLIISEEMTPFLCVIHSMLLIASLTRPKLWIILYLMYSCKI